MSSRLTTRVVFHVSLLKLYHGGKDAKYNMLSVNQHRYELTLQIELKLFWTKKRLIKVDDSIYNYYVYYLVKSWRRPEKDAMYIKTHPLTKMSDPSHLGRCHLPCSAKQVSFKGTLTCALGHVSQHDRNTLTHKRGGTIMTCISSGLHQWGMRSLGAF